MPKKGGDKRRGRRNRNMGTSNATASNNHAKSSPQQARGRKTKNSQLGRKQPTKVPQSKKVSNKSGGRKSLRHQSPPDQPIFFTSDSGELYKPGDFAYVDSQQPDLPYHICIIRSFKMARKESVIAEVKWFYRVTELPEAVYSLLMEDRKKGPDASVFELSGIKDRELFAAFNIDTHPAALFRGKCEVREFVDIKNLSEYITNNDHFFYQHGYKPESRRLTKMDEFSIIPQSQQAVLPDLVISTESNSIQKTDIKKEEDDETKTLIDRYNTSEDRLTGSEELVWLPGIDDDNLLTYLRVARSIALHAGLFMNGLMRDGYMAASSDETTQYAFDVLHKNNYETEKSTVELIKKPIVGRLHRKKNWSKEYSLLFAKGMRQFGKNFHKIKKELLPNKEIHELIEYYYYWKKTNAGISSRNTRKQRKQTHIRMSRSIIKPPEASPEREFIDLSSADEDEVDNEESEKCLSYHACRHCYSTVSPNWHHAGNDKAILCNDCRLFFRRYGCMKPITNAKEPPNFMFKDYHLALAEESGRKTRNSNGIRLPRTGLRNGKIFSKSDSDEDEGESDTSEFSSTESSGDIPVNNPKPLQSRRSLLELMQSDSKTKLSSSSNNTSVESETTMDGPPIKRSKIEETEGNESDDEASEESTTNGDQEDDGEGKGEGDGEGDEGSQKSTEEMLSPSQSSGSSNNEERIVHHVPSAITPSATATLNKESQSFTEEVSDAVPQQFKRVREDNESTCARTDLVYIHPPPELRRAIADPQKTLPPQFSFGTSSRSQSHSHPLQPSATSFTTAAAHIPPSHSQHQSSIPTITPHDPMLPTFVNFPIPPHPLTPIGTPFPVGFNFQAGGAAMGLPIQQFQLPPHVSEREKEEIMLSWRMQASAALQQKHIEIAQAQSTHHLPPGVTFPQVVHHPHPSGTTEQPLVFQFPSMEEMARAQQRSQIPESLVIPSHPFHHLVAATPGIPMEARQHEEQGVSQVPLTLPPGLANFEALTLAQQQAILIQQQQQQQQQLLGTITAEGLVEIQQQVEQVMQEAQKNPSILHHPQVQGLLAHYQRIQMDLYQQQHHMQELMMQHMQQQQEVLKQQQQHQHQQQQTHQQQHQQKFQAQTMRPGVIMNQHQK